MRTSVFCCVYYFMVVDVLAIHAYRKYYVEDECISPQKNQRIFFKLPAEGPDSVGELRSNRFGTYSRTGRNCLLKLKPPEGYGVLATVLKVDFRNHETCKDYIKVFDDEDEEGDKLCGYQERGPNSKNYFSDDEIKVRYHTEEGGTGFNDGFRLIFTVTKLGSNESVCHSPSGFRCRNQRCIWAGVKCDGINNCGDGSDEMPAENSFCTTESPAVIASVVLGAVSFVATLVALCLCCCRVNPQEVKKHPLLDDFPSRPNGGYIPLPGYSYGSVEYIVPSVHSYVQPNAPMDSGQYHSSIPTVHQLRYDRPPPYRT